MILSTDIWAPASTPVLHNFAHRHHRWECATVTYAGWVAGSVAGLYQINATVPTKATAGKSLPVVVTVGSGTA